MTGDAAEISRGLAARAPELCRELLPAGVREGAEWRVGSVFGEKGKSLAVHLFGPKAGVWADFSDGVCGDALDLVAAVRFHGSKAQALDWARAWLGRPGNVAYPAFRGAARDDEAKRKDQEDRERAALGIYLAADERLAGTPVDFYLKRRGIDLAQLGRQPRALRYHAALWNRESNRKWPAMVAAVTNGEGKTSAVHRTWLHQDAAGHWSKAPLREPKMTLGPLAGSSVRLWRGASGKPLRQAPDGEAVVIAEGIETALSIVVACPEMRVLAAVSLANLALVELPPAIKTVIIAADNDDPGSKAEAALNVALEKLLEKGLQVRVARSPVGSDFNDCLVA